MFGSLLQLKEESSRRLRAKYSIIRETRTSTDFWATGYYCGTAGHVSAHQVARYIMEQTKLDAFGIGELDYDLHFA